MENIENWSVERLEAEAALEGKRLIRPAASSPEQHACCCENGGRPFILDGALVTCWNVGCRVHRPLIPLYDPVDFAEPIGRYVRRENLIRDLRR
jgi:hypothetical protein